MEEIASAIFFRKPCSIIDLQDDTPDIKPSPIVVTKVVELSAIEYQWFTTHLLEKAPFIVANRDLMSYDENTGITRCLLVTAQSVRGGILVDSQGFSYARYAAYIPDKSRLKLPEPFAVQQSHKPHHRRFDQER